MNTTSPPRAWLLMAAGDDRGHGGNSGYDDQHDSHYSWDSTVANHKQLQVGDIVAIWDKVELLGTSVIEEIQSEPGIKVLRRCVNPSCGTTRIALRKRALPRYRCMKCRIEFDEPRTDTVAVTLYTARYDAAWTPLEGILTGAELRASQAHPVDINAMRPLDWSELSARLSERGAQRALTRVARRTMDSAWPAASSTPVDFTHGFRHTFVRVRRGQRSFRAHLFNAQGSVCAVTGGAPDQVLEAGHLYSFAELGVHHEHGGFLFRRDIHRLFDDGLLAVNPGSLRVDVNGSLERFPQYARLDGVPLQITVLDQQVSWLEKHWNEHRESAAPS